MLDKIHRKSTNQNKQVDVDADLRPAVFEYATNSFVSQEEEESDGSIQRVQTSNFVSFEPQVMTKSFKEAIAKQTETEASSERQLKSLAN